jgi:hypothetical protein
MLLSLYHQLLLDQYKYSTGELPVTDFKDLSELYGFSPNYFVYLLQSPDLHGEWYHCFPNVLKNNKPILLYKITRRALWTIFEAMQNTPIGRELWDYLNEDEPF